MRGHGNWCGPNWTAGQTKPTSKLSDTDRHVPAIDALDQACKEHDIELHDNPEKANEINNKFINTVKSMGIKGKLYALAVSLAGPSPSFSNMPKKSALRKNYENYVEERKQHHDNENMKNEDKDVLVYDDTELTEVAVDIANAFKQDSPIMKDNINTPARITKRKSNTISPDNKTSKEKFPWESLSKLPRNNTMNDDNEEENTSRTMINARSTENGSNLTKETPITMHSPEYLIPETLTVIMPVTFYFSGICGQDSALDIKIALNSISAPLRTTLNNPGANVGTSIGAVFATGLYTRKISSHNNTIGIGAGTRAINVATNDQLFGAGNYPLAMNWPTTVRAFPSFLPVNTQPLPKMKQWYDKLYEYYTVTECDYQFVFAIQPAIDYLNNDLIVASTIDTYAASRINNQAPNNQKIANVKMWKGMNWQVLKSPNLYDQSSKYQTISGKYKPGTAKHLVQNDGDVKLWTPTTGGPNSGDPEYKEDLHLMVFPHPLNTYHGSSVSTRTGDNSYGTVSALSTFNCECTLKYTVQFKDLKVAMRYFQDSGTNADFPLQYALYSNLINQAVHSGAM